MNAASNKHNLSKVRLLSMAASAERLTGQKRARDTRGDGGESIMSDGEKRRSSRLRRKVEPLFPARVRSHVTALDGESLFPAARCTRSARGQSQDGGIRSIPLQRQPRSGTDKDCLQDYALGKVLGRGDQGVVFDLVATGQSADASTLVIKVIDTTKVAGWQQEVRLGQEISSIELDGKRIAPQIFDVWTCGTYAYIVMERMKSDARSAFTHFNDSKTQDSFSDMPVEVQLRYIRILEKMLEAGYIHMDNHCGNLGVAHDGTPVIFDFGFTQRRSFASEKERMAALGMSLWQIVEHSSSSSWMRSLFGKVIIQVCLGEYAWGSAASYVPEAKKWTKAWKDKMKLIHSRYPQPDDDDAARTQYAQLLHTLAEDKTIPVCSRDFFTAFHAYPLVMSYGIPKRYSVPFFMTAIYQIRRGLLFDVRTVMQVQEEEENELDIPVDEEESAAAPVT